MSVDTYFCFCCLSTNDLKHIHNVESEGNYGKQLLKVFNINISYEDYEYDGYICDECCFKLKEALQFKEQVFEILNVLQGNGLIEIINEDGQVYVKKASSDIAEQDVKSEKSIVKDVTLNHVSDSQEGAQIKNETKNPASPKRQCERDGIPSGDDEKGQTYTITEDLKCEVCGKGMPSVYVYHSHMNQHFPNHICEACGKGFVTEKRLKRHLQSHRAGIFKCQTCDVEFTNYNTLSSHRQRKHSALPVYRCPRCGARFDSLSERARHLERAHAKAPPPRVCHVCGKHFLLAGNLSAHMQRTHHKVKRHWCECGAGFYHRQELLAHATSHTKRYQYHCHHCTKRYARKKALVVHMRTHTDDRRFACEYCGKRFIQKCTLMTHLKIHNRVTEKNNMAVT